MSLVSCFMEWDEWISVADEWREKMHTHQPDRWIYFIQSGCGGPIKIGTAQDPFDRLYNLQIGNPEDLRLLGAAWGSALEERHLHRMLRQEHVRGEWFLPSQRVLEGVLYASWLAFGDLVDAFPGRFPDSVVAERKEAVDAVLAGAA